MPEGKELYDVIVVGAGNAGLCSALSANECGAKVIILEKAPQALRGGNSCYTLTTRLPYRGAEDIIALIPDMSKTEIEERDFNSYSEADFYADLMRATRGKVDSEIAEIVAHNAYSTWKWVAGFGVRWIPFAPGSWGCKGEKVDGKFQAYPGVPIEFSGGGKDYNTKMFEAAEKKGIKVVYEAQAVKLLTAEKERRMQGVRILHEGSQYKDIFGKAVILACGGFEASAEMRSKYLGPNWDLVVVRGSRYNTGDGIHMALELGAVTTGHWSACHAAQVDAAAPRFADSPWREAGKSISRHSYHLGILINLLGERFIDEGEDFNQFTYAKLGKVVLQQPNQLSIQIVDSKVKHLMLSAYKQASPIVGTSIAELADNLSSELGVDRDRAIWTIEDFNRAAQEGIFNHGILDGKCTKGITPKKSNWAQPLDTPPFLAYPVQCGITFTFGGIEVDKKLSRVVDLTGIPIKGLYAAGEIVGFWYHNYPSGADLTQGAVMGKIAGAEAAAYAR
ncbi:FAD-dependent tricarballylate dehydrogenase TcuA [Chloroflexota bacterium]